MSNKLSLPDDARQWLARRYENQHKAWLAGEGAWPLGVPLGSPVEADVARDYAVVRGWAEAWQRYKGSGRIVWEERRWARLGQQRIPVRLEFDAPAEVAEAVGQDSRWRCENSGPRWRRTSGITPIRRTRNPEKFGSGRGPEGNRSSAS